MAHVFIGFGTNLGDRVLQLRDARARVSRFVEISRTSSVYETEPWGVAEQPYFMNLVLEGETTLTPQELLHALKRIENEMGRLPGLRYGPRVIDLDILLYDDLILESGQLEIPHPRLAERSFVLVPLAELAPDLVPPGLQSSIRDLLAQRSDAGGVTLYANSLE